MPIASQIDNFKVTPLQHDPKETKVRFGAIVEGVDLNDVDGEPPFPHSPPCCYIVTDHPFMSDVLFEAIKDAVLTHKLLIFKVRRDHLSSTRTPQKRRLTTISDRAKATSTLPISSSLSKSTLSPPSHPRSFDI